MEKEDSIDPTQIYNSQESEDELFESEPLAIINLDIKEDKKEKAEFNNSIEDFMKGITNDDLLPPPTVFDEKKEIKRIKYDYRLDTASVDMAQKFIDKCDEFEDEKEYFTMKMQAAKMVNFMREKINIFELRYCSYKDMVDIKMKCLSLYQDKLRNGFHTGFFNMALCYKCDAVLDTWPSRQKVVFWIPDTHCGFCAGDIKRITVGEIRRELARPTDNSKFYQYKVTFTSV